MNRWIIALAGIVMQVALGSVYACMCFEFRSRGLSSSQQARRPIFMRAVRSPLPPTELLRLEVFQSYDELGVRGFSFVRKTNV